MATPDDLQARRAAPRAVASPAWLGIIGIGEDGVEGLGSAARSWIEESEFVFGGARQLALARPLIRGEAHPWPRPFDRELEQVLARRGRRVTVLASGDPFHFGVGPLLAARTAPHERHTIPSVSSFSLAAARLGWSLQDTHTLSAHGRTLDRVRAALAPNARLLVLTSDANGPRELADLLCAEGFERAHLHVLERLGGPRERTRSAEARAFELRDIDPLQIVGVECGAPTRSHAGWDDARAPLCPGLPDEAFEHDGQITKRDVRIWTLGRLAPRSGERLWDIGAGSGSIAIEWLRLDPELEAYAIEARAERAERIERNARKLGVPQLRVIHGRAPAALRALPAPDCVFVGGGAERAVFDAALDALQPGGRLIANAVTFETEAQLRTLHQLHGGELVQLAVAHAAPLGAFRAWQPARPIVQWSVTKP